MPRPGAFRLPKTERLHHKRAFTYLFEHGSSFRVGVLKFFYVRAVPKTVLDTPLSVAVTAPKRVFRKAVTRNFLKRRMREAYRLHKQDLWDTLVGRDQNLMVLVKFQGYYPAPFERIEQDMKKGLARLQEIAQRKHTKE